MTFRDADYLAATGRWRDAIAHLVAAGPASSRRPAAIRLLTNLRLLGYVFNPVSFWYLAAPTARGDRAPRSATRSASATRTC